MRREELLGGGCEPLAEGRHLGSHIVTPAGHRQALVFDGQSGQTIQGRHDAVQYQLQAPPDLQLLDVLGQVP